MKIFDIQCGEINTTLCGENIETIFHSIIKKSPTIKLGILMRYRLGKRPWFYVDPLSLMAAVATQGKAK